VNPRRRRHNKRARKLNKSRVKYAVKGFSVFVNGVRVGDFPDSELRYEER
jgi:hypothetical protein